MANKQIQYILGGAFAGLVSRTVVAPLDRLHNLIVVRSAENPTEVISSLLKNEGILGLWRGNFVNCCKIAPTTAVKFFVTESLKNYAKEYYKKQGKKIPFSTNFMIGAFGAIISTMVSHPIDVVRTKMTIETSKNRKYNSFFQTTSLILKEEGISGLYRGLGISLIGVTPFQAVNNACFEFTNNRIPNFALKKLVQGAISSSVAFCTCYPLDVVKRKMMAKKYNNFVDCVSEILK